MNASIGPGHQSSATPGAQTRSAKLRQLLQSAELEFLMEAHNGLSARIVREAGFKGIWASGLSISAQFGVRDNNEASWTQVVDMLEFMVDASDLPILLDGDTGLRGDGGPDVTRTLGPAPGRAALLAGDGDEAEIADRGPGRARLPLDHHHPLAQARGRQGVGQAHDSRTDDGQIEGSWHGLGRFSQKNNRGTY